MPSIAVDIAIGDRLTWPPRRMLLEWLNWTEDAFLLFLLLLPLRLLLLVAMAEEEDNSFPIESAPPEDRVRKESKPVVVALRDDCAVCTSRVAMAKEVDFELSLLLNRGTAAPPVTAIRRFTSAMSLLLKRRYIFVAAASSAVMLLLFERRKEVAAEGVCSRIDEKFSGGRLKDDSSRTPPLDPV